MKQSCRSDDEREAINDRLGLFAPTAEVACIALFDPIRVRPAVLYRKDLGDVPSLEPVVWQNEPFDVTGYDFANESELLKSFWQMIESYESMITFNGRGFDCPFITQRSLILGIRMTKGLSGNRYNVRQHLDLCDYLTHFGASRRYSLDLWMRALGMASPKSQGIDGSKVKEAIDAGKLIDVTNYCMRDTVATAELASKVASTYPLDDYSILCNNK